MLKLYRSLTVVHDSTFGPMQLDIMITCLFLVAIVHVLEDQTLPLLWVPTITVNQELLILHQMGLIFSMTLSGMGPGALPVIAVTILHSHGFIVS